jgi:nitronate monooxygenase
LGKTVVALREQCDCPGCVAATASDDPARDTEARMHKVITTAFSGMWPDAPHRVLRSAVAAVETYKGESVGEMDIGRTRMTIPKGAVPSPTENTTGEISAMALYAGESVSKVVRVQKAAEVVRELADGAELLLRAWR